MALCLLCVCASVYVQFQPLNYKIAVHFTHYERSELCFEGLVKVIKLFYSSVGRDIPQVITH
jgi:hypothetical protein